MRKVTHAHQPLGSWLEGQFSKLHIHCLAVGRGSKQWKLHFQLEEKSCTSTTKRLAGGSRHSCTSHLIVGSLRWGVIIENCTSMDREKFAHRLLGSCTSTTSQLHKTGTKLHKKSLSKHIHAGSSFEEHIARISVVKADLNFKVWFKSYDFFKKQKLKSKLDDQLSFVYKGPCIFFIHRPL